MKFFFSTLLIALLSYLLCLYGPWWTIALAAFVVALAVKQSPWRSFGAGFMALFLLWGILAFATSGSNAHLLAGRVAEMVLKVNKPSLLILLTAFIGATVAGFAALTGTYLRKLITL
jgi:hypothetical protein